MASKLYGVDATIIIFVFVLYCIVVCYGEFSFIRFVCYKVHHQIIRTFSVNLDVWHRWVFFVFAWTVGGVSTNE